MCMYPACIDGPLIGKQNKPSGVHLRMCVHACGPSCREILRLSWKFTGLFTSAKFCLAPPFFLGKEWTRVKCGQEMSDRVLMAHWCPGSLSAAWACLLHVISLWWSPMSLIQHFLVEYFGTSCVSPLLPNSLELENNQDVDLVRCEAPCGVMCLRLIEYFDQKPCLIYIEMIPLVVEKIRINWFPWDPCWKSFEAVQSRGVENVSKNCT